MSIHLLCWIGGQISALCFAAAFGIWMESVAPALVVWYALSLLVDIRKQVSE